MKKPKPKKPDQPETKEQRQQRERRERQRELSFDGDEIRAADEDAPTTTSCGIPGLSQSLPGMPAVLSMDRGRLLRRAQGP